MNTNTVVGLSLGLGLGGCVLALLIGGLIFYLGCCDAESSRVEGAEESPVEVGGIPLRSKAPKLSPEELEFRETAIRRYKRRLRREAAEKRREEARMKQKALKEAASLSAHILVPTLLQSTETYAPNSGTKKHEEGGTNAATNDVLSAADNQSALFREIGGSAAHECVEDRNLESEEDSESLVSCDTAITASTDAYGRAVYEAEREAGFSRGISSRCSSFVSEGFNSFRLDNSAMWKRESLTVDPHSSAQGGGRNQNRSHQRTMERKRRQRLHAEQFSTAAIAQHFSSWEATFDPFDEIIMEEVDTRIVEMDVEERQTEREGPPYTSYTTTSGTSGVNVSHHNPHVSFAAHGVADSGEVDHTNQNFISSASPDQQSHVPVSLSSSFCCRESESPPNASKEIPPNGRSDAVVHTAISSLDPVTGQSSLHRFPAGVGVASRREDHTHRPVSQSTIAILPPPHSHCLSAPSPETRVKHSDPTRRPEGHVEETIAISGFFRSQLAPLPPISGPGGSTAPS